MGTIITLVVWALFAWACYSIAESKNRNAVLWAVLGVLFGFISLIIIALLPPVEEKGLL